MFTMFSFSKLHVHADWFQKGNMPCHVTIHGNEAAFLTDLPRHLKAVNLPRLSPGFDTKDFVIKVGSYVIFYSSV